MSEKLFTLQVHTVGKEVHQYTNIEEENLAIAQRKLWEIGIKVERERGKFELISPFHICTAYFILQPERL